MSVGYWQSFVEIPAQPTFSDFRRLYLTEQESISLRVYLFPVITFAICATMFAKYSFIRSRFLWFTGISLIKKAWETRNVNLG